MTMTQFKIGDLVFIIQGIHDKRMPFNRIGVIVGYPSQAQSLGTEVLIWNVLFTNGEVLRFHKRWMAKAYDE